MWYLIPSQQVAQLLAWVFATEWNIGFASKSSIRSFFFPYAIEFLINRREDLLLLWCSMDFQIVFQLYAVYAALQPHQQCGADFSPPGCALSISGTTKRERRLWGKKLSLYGRAAAPGQLSGSIATSSVLSIWWFYAIAIGKESTGKGWWASSNGEVLKTNHTCCRQS